MKEKEIEVEVLEYPMNIRTRTGMYLGDTSTPNVGLREIIDNSIDELLGSTIGTQIDIQVKSGQNGGWYVVADNGRGIPITWVEDKNKTMADLALTTLNAGSKFKKDGDISIGLNGVGAAAYLATCERFVVLSKITSINFNRSIPEVKELWENNSAELEPFYVAEYEKGYKVYEGALLKSDIFSKYEVSFPENFSTIILSKPDPEIYESTVCKVNLKSMSYVYAILTYFNNKECNIVMDGKSVSNKFEPYEFQFIKELEVPGLKENDPTRRAKFFINFEVDKNMSVFETTGSINSLEVNRGVHIDWGKRAYCSALSNYFNLQHDYDWCGLKMNVICLTNEMDFSSQTKERCTSINKIHYIEIENELIKEFKKVFKQNQGYFESHIERLNEYADSLRSISAIEKVKSVVGTLGGGNRVRSKIPSSVKDASEARDRSKCELFICEGMSASSTMLQSRDANIHAIMELRGVPLNSVNLDLDTIMDNQEMSGIITALGCGVNEYFDMDSLRYGKIILTADADADGAKINTLMLGFIAKKMTFLLDAGKVFVALAPLYDQNGTYVYPGENPKDIIDLNKPYKRYKGLGEINVLEAKKFFFNEDTRRLLQITNSNLEYVLNLLTNSYYRKDLMISSEIITDIYDTGIL